MFISERLPGACAGLPLVASLKTDATSVGVEQLQLRITGCAHVLMYSTSAHVPRTRRGPGV